MCLLILLPRLSSIFHLRDFSVNFRRIDSIGDSMNLCDALSKCKVRQEFITNSDGFTCSKMETIISISYNETKMSTRQTTSYYRISMANLAHIKHDIKNQRER